MVSINLSKNEKQAAFHNSIMNELSATSAVGNRYFIYGGAIRGGKTFVCLADLLILLTLYEGARGHVIRAHTNDFVRTTMPSARKLISDSPEWRWFNSPSDYHIKNRNGSEVHFVAESYESDKDLNRFKGLETNFIVLEQLDELHEQTLDKCLERAGSWYVKNMPPAFLLGTTNPTQGWVKERIYLPHRAGQLKTPWFYQEALPTDNPFVTDDQRLAWANMDEVSYRRFIEGDWDAVPNSNLFAYAFKKDFHVGTRDVGENEPILVSFDFNVNPMTALILQYYRDTNSFYFIEEYYLRNSDVNELCQRIYAKYHGRIFKVTGDASGNNRTATNKEFQGHFYQIAKHFKINYNSSVEIASANMAHAKSQMIANSLFEKDRVLINPLCKELIRDLQSVKMLDSFTIDKSDAMRGHLLDCMRYAFNAWANYKKLLS